MSKGLMWRRVFSPLPEVGRGDTSLRYTDILFGFVIKELFVRLQNWPTLDWMVRWHLIVGTTLVLGSWIGYRRSSNRTSFEVKFFNLPFFKFLVDQLMLILYFRIAILTAADGRNSPDVLSALTEDTVRLVLYVFVLYLLWDMLGIWMTEASRGLKYLEAKQETLAPSPALILMLTPTQALAQITLTPPSTPMQKPDPKPVEWLGFGITGVALVLFMGLHEIVGSIQSTTTFVWTTVVLVAYRWAKEVRSSCR